MKLNKRFALVAGILVLFTGGAMAQANRLQDLVGARGSSGETELENRGYVVTHGDQSDDSSYTYWWNRSAKKCVVIRTTDGKYASIVDTTSFDCNQKETSGGSGTATAVGIGAAAAIIGAIALAHRAHDHEDGRHSDNVNNEAEYERGYRDGLYNNSYHNYSNTDSYKQGYQSGVNQRDRQTRYSSRRGGYVAFVNLNDLQGIRASSGESEMQSRGFRNVDSLKSGNTSYTIWWNSRTRQCVQVATADGRYVSVVDIQTHPNCR